MNDFLNNLGSSFKELGTKVKGGVNKLLGKETTASGGAIVSTVKSNYEINLVPEVKAQMIRAQKTRNLVLFLCILVSSVAVGVVVILFGVKSGQDIVMATQDNKLDLMSKTLNSYSELNNLVTIQGQLQGIADITDQKTVLSRVFSALSVTLPQGADSVRLSELNVNLDTGVVRMDGQADARVDPLIDYRVLESLKKSIALTKYDYGRYVDANGNEIPSYCISETDAEGSAYKSGENYYAWWDLTIEGCEAVMRGAKPEEGVEFSYSSTAEVEEGIKNADGEVTICTDENNNCAGMVTTVTVIDPETGEPVESETEVVGEDVKPVRVKIWRTPQFDEWYDSGKMSLDGTISEIEHFNSACTTYAGTLTGSSTSTTNKNSVRWNSTNDCMLAPDGFDITSSSNGRDESENLVLKFTGTSTFDKKFFSFNNKHMIALGPLGQNVTDSYVQIGNMFAQEATECAPDDTECLTNASNRGGN